MKQIWKKRNTRISLLYWKPSYKINLNKGPTLMLIMLDSPLTLLIVAVWGMHVRNEPSIRLAHH